jgi:hypothetical protein
MEKLVGFDKPLNICFKSFVDAIPLKSATAKESGIFPIL